MLKLDFLKKYYFKGRPNEVRAVDGISLELPSSGMVALFGRSGCGKTTLLNIIGGLDKPTDGFVSVDGEMISPDSTEARNRKIGYIFQNYNLSSDMTVFENVAMSLRLCGMTDKAEIERRVVIALKSVDMAKYRNRYPDALSGGQKQRVAIARAIVKRPGIILADEPTGNLDEHNTVQVMQLLKELSENCLVLLVTHEADLVDLYCDKVIELSDGKIMNIKENRSTNGYREQGKNDVYLGDMSHERVEGDNGLSIDLYREKTDENENIGLRLIVKNGVVYIEGLGGTSLKLGGVSSELKVYEGSYDPVTPEETQKHFGELTELSEIGTGKCGRMYGFFDIWKSYRGRVKAQGKTKKTGKKLLTALLVIAAMIITSSASSFGTVFKTLSDVERSYDKNMAVLQSGFFSDLTSDELRGVMDTGYVETVSIVNTEQGMNATLDMGGFESALDPSVLSISTNVFVLPHDHMRSNVIVGENTIKNSNDIIISKGMADKILESTSLDFISSYDDLISLSTNIDYFHPSVGNSFEIIGITDDISSRIYINNEEFYLTELENIMYMGYTFGAGGETGNGYDISVQYKSSIFDNKLPENGEIFIYVMDGLADPYGTAFELDGAEEPVMAKNIKVGDSVIINGHKYKVADHKILPSDFWSTNTVDNEYFYNCGVVMALDDIKVQQTELLYKMTDRSEQSVYLFSDSSYDGLKEYIKNNFDKEGYITSDNIKEGMMTELRPTLIFETVRFVLTVVAMAVCLYFMSRASIMKSMKEIGIFRTVGASKKNIIFRFSAEAFLQFLHTTLVGFLIGSVSNLFVSNLLGSIMIGGNVVYYPVWLAGLTLLMLLLISIVCGTLPAVFILNKTPSEIMAKYDI